MNKGRNKIGMLPIAGILSLLLGIQALQELKKEPQLWLELAWKQTIKSCMELWCPSVEYAQSDWNTTDFAEQIRLTAWQSIPLYLLLKEQEPHPVYAQSDTPEDIVWQLRTEEEAELYASMEAENEAALAQGAQEEQQAAENAQEIEQVQEMQETPQQTQFIPEAAKKASYLPEQLADPQFIREQFFTVDATTDISMDRLQIDKLLGFDAALQQDAASPQILIYHTHSQETYADSIPQDATTSIMGVGEYLAAILRQEYGYHVLHHLGQYDVESRDYAYSNAAQGIEEVLAQNPSIEVMIDLHRDEMQEGVRLVTQLQGRTMAKFMFFNGLSYTKERGEIASLPNPYIQENLAFAFQMKLAAEEYYPGLTRKSYLKGYRYNLQYRPKSLLIELGAQTNTVEEAMNACLPLAHILDVVLKGEMSQ